MNRKIKLTQDLIDIRAFAEANNENTRKRFNSPQTTPTIGSDREEQKILDTLGSELGRDKTADTNTSELWSFLEIEGGKG